VTGMCEMMPRHRVALIAVGHRSVADRACR
jgi:hypothetical protein